MDETWVCYDRQLIDDQLYELWGKFKASVRILVLSDNCTAARYPQDSGPRLRSGLCSRRRRGE